jgi:hypothetical protein
MRELRELEDLEKLFEAIVDAVGKQEGIDLFATRSREGFFAPALVMWLTICQKLQQRQSLASALESIRLGECDLILRKNNKAKAHPRKISLNTGGLCRARSRLQYTIVNKTCQALTRYLLQESGKGYLWREKIVLIVDGTVIKLAYTDSILKKYKPVKNQNGESHHPNMLSLCAHELSTGVGLVPVFGPYRGNKATSEHKLYRKLVSRIEAEVGGKALVIMDRLYGRFPTVYWTNKLGHQILVRLPITQARMLAGKKLGKKDFDLNVNWCGKASYKNRIPKGSEVPGRVIQHTVRRRGHRPLTLWFFTTSTEPAQDITDLYLQRERIENDIRSLKEVFELEMLYSKTPCVLEKELLLSYAAYNLLRAIIAKAAHRLGISPRQLSFSRVARLTRIYGNKLRGTASSKERKLIVEQYLADLNQSKLPHRKKRRMEPRKCVFIKRRFPLMKNSRDEERAEALGVAKNHGHRGQRTTVSRKS